MDTKIHILLLTLTMILAATAVTAPGVGSIDTECQRYGFDYGIAKYQCGSTTPDEGDGSTITVSWTGTTECSAVDWTADPAVAGVLSKEGLDYYVYAGGISGTITPTGQNSISHITFCGEETTTVPESAIIIGVISLMVPTAIYIARKKQN